MREILHAPRLLVVSEMTSVAKYARDWDDSDESI